MTQNVFKILDYFNSRLQGIIKFEDEIERLRIFVTITQSYGRDYFRIHFDVDVADKFLEKITKEQRQQIHYYFSNISWTSGNQFVSTLVYNENDERGIADAYADRLRNYKEFLDCYNYLTSFFVMFLETRLGKRIKIIVESLDSHPSFSYIERFWKSINFTTESYRYQHNTDFEKDNFQYVRLMQLAEKSKSHYENCKEDYIITDEDIFRSYAASKTDIRWFILKYELPILIDGFRTIDTIHINIKSLESILISLEKEISESEEIKKDGLFLPFVRDSIEKAYEIFKNEKLRSKKLRKILLSHKIYEGDVLLLADKKVIQITRIEIKDRTVVYHYSEIKKDLSQRKRSGVLDINTVSKYLPKEKFIQNKTRYEWHLKWQLLDWLQRKGKSFKV